MATFADFILAQAVESYGGAEVLRAYRVRPHGGVDTPAHLALLGRTPAALARASELARIGESFSHKNVARIHEVGSFDGAVYAVADAVEGVSLLTLIDYAKRSHQVPPPSVALAVAVQLAELALDLCDDNTVFAEHDAGICGVFAGDVRLDGIVINGDGQLQLRSLAAVQQIYAAGEYREAQTRVRHSNSPYLPPECARRRAGAPANVYVVMQVLRALLGADASCTLPPRLPPRGGALPTLLVSALAPWPDERPALDDVFASLGQIFHENAPGSDPRTHLANALRREYRALVTAPHATFKPSRSDVRAMIEALPAVRRRLHVTFPRTTALAEAERDDVFQERTVQEEADSFASPAATRFVAVDAQLVRAAVPSRNDGNAEEPAVTEALTGPELRRLLAAAHELNRAPPSTVAAPTRANVFERVVPAAKRESDEFSPSGGPFGEFAVATLQLSIVTVDEEADLTARRALRPGGRHTASELPFVSASDVEACATSSGVVARAPPPVLDGDTGLVTRIDVTAAVPKTVSLHSREPRRTKP